MPRASGTPLEPPLALPPPAAEPALPALPPSSDAGAVPPPPLAPPVLAPPGEEPAAPGSAEPPRLEPAWAAAPDTPLPAMLLSIGNGAAPPLGACELQPHDNANIKSELTR